MLQDMRDRMTGPLVWGIIGLLCLVFAIWGIGADSFFGGGADPTLAKVGNHEITQSAFQRAYNQKYQRMLQLMGDNFNPSQINQARFSTGVLDNMIEQALLQQYADNSGYVTPDTAVYTYLSQIPAFQVDGKFSAKAYRAALAGAGMSTEQFEGQVQQSLRVQQLRRSVLGTAFLVPKQALATWAVEHETRDVSQAVFAAADYAKSVKIQDAQVQQYYDAHKSDYISPQQVKLAYIRLSQKALAPAGKPDADVLKAIYEVQKGQRFTTPGKRKASHILIHFGSDKKAAQQQAESVEAQLDTGADFATLAKKYSDDPGSKNKGGSLGWIARGMTAPAFEQALFGLSQAGAVSKPVKTKFGWDIIRLDAVRAPQVQPFSDADVQAKLLETYRSRAAAKAYGDDSTALANLVFENPNSLKPAAEKLGLNVQTTDWITHDGGTGISAKPGVIAAAFSKSVLKDGENSKPITIGAADQVVVRKLKARPERQLSFDEVKGRIQQMLTAQAAESKAHAAAKAFADRVRGGEAFALAAKKAGVKVKTLEGLKRDDSHHAAALVAAVFGMHKPDSGSAPSVTITQIQDHQAGLPATAKPDTAKPDTAKPAADTMAYAVVALDAVHRQLPKAGGRQFASAARSYSQTVAGAELKAYQTLMKKSVSIKHEKSPVAEQTSAS